MTQTLTTPLAAIAIAIAALVAGAALPAAAQQQEFSVSFQYDRTTSAEDNYRVFLRQAQDACSNFGARSLDEAQHQRACVDDLMDKLVARMARTQLAVIHLQRTGRSIVDTPAFAAR